MPLPPGKRVRLKSNRTFPVSAWHCIELLLTNNSRATQLYTKNLVVSMIWGNTGGKESSPKTKSNTFELDFVCLPILSIPVGVRFYLESRRITDHGVTFSRVGGRQQKFCSPSCGRTAMVDLFCLSLGAVVECCLLISFYWFAFFPIWVLYENFYYTIRCACPCDRQPTLIKDTTYKKSMSVVSVSLVWWLATSLDKDTMWWVYVIIVCRPQKLSV